MNRDISDQAQVRTDLACQLLRQLSHQQHTSKIMLYIEDKMTNSTRKEERKGHEYEHIFEQYTISRNTNWKIHLSSTEVWHFERVIFFNCKFEVSAIEPFQNQNSRPARIFMVSSLSNSNNINVG